MFVAVRSIRDSYSLIVDRLPQWLVETVEVRRGDYAVPEESIREFWVAMGIRSESILAKLIKINPEWRDGKLWVSGGDRLDIGFYEDLCAVMLYIFRFVKFTESRWVTVGKVSKTISLSESVGLRVLIQSILD